jgi:hypothetical protein
VDRATSAATAAETTDGGQNGAAKGDSDDAPLAAVAVGALSGECCMGGDGDRCDRSIGDEELAVVAPPRICTMVDGVTGMSGEGLRPRAEPAAPPLALGESSVVST